MKIRIVERKQELEAAGLIPAGLIKPHTTVFCCEEDGTCTGAAVLEKQEGRYVLLWLYVALEKRKLGYGSALLKDVADWAEKQGAECLVVIYEAGCESGPVLDLLFARQNFSLKLEQTARVRVTRDELRASALMQMQEIPLKPGCRITPLSHISTMQLKQLMERCKKRGYSLVSQADYSQADAKRSLVLLSGQDVQGILLLHHESADGVFSIPLLFVEKEYLPAVVELLRKAAKALLEPAANLKLLEFSCMEDTVLKLTDRFVPEKELLWDEIVTGELWF